MKSSIGIMYVVMVFAAFCGEAGVIATERVYAKERRNMHLKGERDVALSPLKGGGWRYTLKANSIVKGVDHYEIKVPELLVARKGEPGFWVLDDGRYGTFRCDAGAVSEGPRRAMMPIAGFSSPRGSWYVIVRGLRLECDFGVSVTNGEYSLAVRFRTDDLALPTYEDGVIDFLPMPAGATYVDIARRYREEQLKNGVVRPLVDRAKERADLAYMVESILVRVKHGWKTHNTNWEQKRKWEHQSPTNQPPIHTAISFDDFKEIMRRMKEVGIDKAEVCSVGGTAAGFDGQFPDLLPIPEEFGGERKLREAIAYGKSLGYHLATHFTTTAMFECSKDWNTDYICRTPDGRLLTAGLVSGGRTHRLCPRVYLDRFMKPYWETLRDFGLHGTIHLDVISAIPPYQCFNEKHPLNRPQSAECMREICRYTRQMFGGLSSEAGFDWVAPELDFALYVTPYPGAKLKLISPLIDRMVPFWQVVYHGIIVSNPFYATIDAYVPHDMDPMKGLSDDPVRFSYMDTVENRVLKLHEFGGRPIIYYLVSKDVTPIKRAYDDYQLLSHLQYQFIDDHRELAKDAYLTRYSNGEEMVVNYGDAPYAYRGRDVGPKRFELYAPAK